MSVEFSNLAAAKANLQRLQQQRALAGFPYKGRDEFDWRQKSRPS
jgi:hypothetical protein